MVNKAILLAICLVVFVDNSQQGSVFKHKTALPEERQMQMRAIGDPHFQALLNADIRMCFQWSGQDGDIFNLLSDYSMPLFVNARFSSIGKSGDGQFLTVISFVLPEEDLIITVTPLDVTLNNTRTNHVKTIAPGIIEKPHKVFEKNGIEISVSKTLPQVQLSIHDVHFEISERNRRHLDIVVDNPEALSQNLGGIFGEPYKQQNKPKVVEVNGRNFLQFNKRLIPIHKPKTEADGEKFPCWHLKDPTLITNHSKDFFKVPSLYKPLYK